MLEPDTTIHGRYTVVRLIGRGGMGAVYEATDARLAAPVALKQTLVSGLTYERAFAREAAILAGVRHPSLPKVIDFFVEERGQFLVMEFIGGPNLAELLEERGQPFPPDVVLAWADDLLDALAYLHGHTPPIIHRDVKPQNVKLGSRGEAVLLDFGLAKGNPSASTPLATLTASLHGYTLQYAPLEQIRGVGTDARSDLYALGGTLYHLLVGQPPPDALERAAAVLARRSDPLTLPAYVPPAVGAALTRALALDPAARPPTAAGLRVELRGQGGEATIPLASALPAASMAQTDTEFDADVVSIHGARARKTRPLSWQVERRRSDIRLAGILVAAMVLALGFVLLRAGTIAPSPPGYLSGGSLARFATPVPIVEQVPMSYGYPEPYHASRPTVAAYPPPLPINGRDGQLPTVASLTRDPPALTPTVGDVLWANSLRTGSIDSLTFTRSGSHVIATTGRGTILALRVEDGREGSLAHFGDLRVFQIAPSADGTRLAVAMQNGSLMVWQTTNSSPVAPHTPSIVRLPNFEYGLHHAATWGVAVTPDGQYAATASADGTARLVRLNDGYSTWTWQASGWLQAVAFAPNGQMVALAGEQPVVVLLDAVSGRKRSEITLPSGEITTVAFSPDGALLAVGGRGSDVSVYRVSDGALLQTLSGSWTFASRVAFSPDGQTLAAGTNDSAVWLWRVEDGALVQRLLGHRLAVSDIAFAPDGRTIASASLDGSVRLWRVR
jgi:WD40 repeat protein